MPLQEVTRCRIPGAPFSCSLRSSLWRRRQTPGDYNFNNRTLFNTLAEPNVLLTFDKIGPPPQSRLTLSCQLTCDVIVDDARGACDRSDWYSQSFGGGMSPSPKLAIFCFRGRRGSKLLVSIHDRDRLRYNGNRPLVIPTGYPGNVNSPAIAWGCLMNVTGPTFFGFISDSPFFSLCNLIEFPERPPISACLRLTDPAVLDNLAIRTVPEPSTALLFGSAFALLQVVRYRRDRHGHSSNRTVSRPGHIRARSAFCIVRPVVGLGHCLLQLSRLFTVSRRVAARASTRASTNGGSASRNSGASVLPEAPA